MNKYATREEMKEIALGYMTQLGLSENVINDFKNEDLLNESENGGYLYWLNDEEKKIVDDYESESGNLVYHVIHNFMQIEGVDEPFEMYNLLIVTKYNEDREFEAEGVRERFVESYVYNKSVPEFSEYGSITVRQKIGGLVRMY